MGSEMCIRDSPVTVRQPDLIEHPAMLSAGVLPVGAIEWIDDHCLVCLLAYDEVIEVVPLAKLGLQYHDPLILNNRHWIHWCLAFTHRMYRWAFK
mgnify:CR=1 FL=1